MLRQLNKILASAPFRASEQCRKFLQYVVSEAVEGRSEGLKERTVGAALFNRKPEYDTHNDSIVRVRANEVRRRLRDYYAEHPDPVLIELPRGSYVPEFRQVRLKEEGELLSVAGPGAAPLAWRALRFSRRSWLLLAAGLTGLAGTLAWIQFTTTPVEKFWQPWLTSGRPIVIHFGDSYTYQLSRRVQNDYLRDHPELLESLSPYGIVLPKDYPLRAEDVVAVHNDTISPADAGALANLSVLFRDHKATFRWLQGTNLPPSDLKEQPIVFIGSFSNRWTTEVTRDLRFHFARSLQKERATWMIRDRVSGKSWELVNVFPVGNFDRDYALITRLQTAKGRAPTLAIGGIGSYGTTAAIELVSDPLKFEDFVVRAPADWAEKNLQILLEVKVVGSATTRARIIEIHSW